VRDLTRRLSPLALAGLALAATVAGWPAPALATPAANSSSPARHRPSVLPPAAMFGRAASESSAVLRLASHNRSGRVPAEQAPVPAGGGVTPLGQLRSSDVLVIAPKALPRSTAATLAKLPGVVAAQSLDAAQIKIKGTEAAVLGVDPSAFRGFAAKPTARSSELWQGVADGRIAVSWTMGRLGKLPLGGRVKVTGKHTERLMVGGFGTVGIPGIDGIVSHAVARSLGLPSGNAVVISAPKARLTTLDAQIRQHLPRGATVVPLVTQEATSATPVSQSGLAGASGSAAQDGPGLTQAQLVTFLKAAESRIGLPYVWGGSGPKVFDCSGLVQWSLAQAGVTVPRVAVDQARTGPAVPVSQLQAGDLLFYHTDPTAPTYISHVAIYLGHGQMLQAPRPGLNVEVVPVDTGSGFAGAVRVYPQVAAAAAGVSG
jgi:cell wall-associated NlpC family hydrolase